MVAFRVVLDDVIYALKGKRIEADRQRRLTIPSYASPDGKRVIATFDVSDEGSRELDRIIAEAEKAAQSAWTPVVALIEKQRALVADQPGRRRRKSAPEKGNPEESGEDWRSGSEAQ